MSDRSATRPRRSGRPPPGRPRWAGVLAPAYGPYDLGQRGKDPLVVIAATPTQPVNRKQVSEGAATDAGPEQGAATPPLAAILGKARELAEGDKILLAMIGEITAGEPRGQDGGTRQSPTAVRAGIADIGRDVFKGGALAEVSMVGNSASDFDLRVYEANSNLNCFDEGFGDRPSCSWTPRWTGRFTVKASNIGWRSNHYRPEPN